MTSFENFASIRTFLSVISRLDPSLAALLGSPEFTLRILLAFGGRIRHSRQFVSFVGVRFFRGKLLYPEEQLAFFAMVSVSQMFESDTRRPFSSLLMSTYGPQEGGVTFDYKLDFTVSAKVDKMTPKEQKKLVTYMIETLGYDTCTLDSRKNTIHVFWIDGVNPEKVLKYVQKLDGTAKAA